MKVNGQEMIKQVNGQYPALRPSARSSKAKRVPNATTLSTAGCDEIRCTSSTFHNCKYQFQHWIKFKNNIQAKLHPLILDFGIFLISSLKFIFVVRFSKFHSF